MLSTIKSRKKFESSRLHDRNVTCPSCGTSHHFDLGCSICMDALQLRWGAKAYQQLHEKIMERPGLTLRELAWELGTILRAFRLMAKDFMSHEECEHMGLMYFNFMEKLGILRNPGKPPRMKKGRTPFSGSQKPGSGAK